MSEKLFDTENMLRYIAKKSDIKIKEPTDSVLIVAIQHIMETTVDMLMVLQEYGLNNIIIGGKKYSTHPPCAKKIENIGLTYIHDGDQLGYGRFDDSMQNMAHRIWSSALEKIKIKKYRLIIIIDDGADLLRATPAELFNKTSSSKIKNKPEIIIGIEQTRGGTNHPMFHGLPFPIIDVAGSYSKTKIEYPKVSEIIALQVVRLLKEQPLRKPNASELTIGVLGYGTMGKVIARQFVSLGFPVIVYEKNLFQIDHLPELTYFDNASVMIANADIIIGCTGQDVTADPPSLSALLYSRQDKTLISTGSKDYEFNNLLRIIQNETRGIGNVPDPFKDICYKNISKATIKIIRGGFPVNFTNKAHSVPAEHIWTTRAALMLACLYACQITHKHFTDYDNNINQYMLPVEIQSLIIHEYFLQNPFDEDLQHLTKLPKNDQENYIISRSDGHPFIITPNETLTEL